MRRIFALCTVVGLGLTALAASSAAQAAFHFIRWDGTGFCQVWDDSIPTTPFPSDYKSVSAEVPSFVEALGAKEGLLRRGVCTF